MIYLNKKKQIFALIFLTLSFISNAQDKELNNKLNHYFEKIPVCQSIDSIIVFLKTNTIAYETSFYKDSITATILEFDTYYYQKDSSDTHIYYRGSTSIHIQDTVYIEMGIMGTSLYSINAMGAKIRYKKLKREFSKHFAKTSSKRNYNSFTGSRGQSTYFYLNKKDLYPYMEINWHSALCLTGNGCNIWVYKTAP